MKCPNCADTNLVMSERQGVEIDYCPNCRGIWLDRGELDKIIEKAISSEKGNNFQSTPHQNSDYRQNNKHNDHSNYRKKHWLSELFD